jgi:hypothetical protein
MDSKKEPMTKAKVLALLIGLALLFTLPATVLAQRVPPHVYVGAAAIDNAPAPDGTTVTAWIDGRQAASTTVSGGSYTIQVDQGDASFADKRVSFKVGGNDAAQSATWSFGGSDELNLTAAAAQVTRTVFAEVIANNDNLARVWRYSNATQTWAFFDPRPAFAAANTLTNTSSRDIVWVNVKVQQTFQGQTLFPGWNLISLQ